MYHRFHAPCEGSVSTVNYISGDTWNVNPVALKRIERLYCRNERAVIDMQLAGNRGYLTLVPVAAILVAGIHLHCLKETLDLRYRGSNRLICNRTYARGEEMGYFQHGSTIILFAEQGVEVLTSIEEGMTVRAGQALLQYAAVATEVSHAVAAMPD
jgi:phosphatidylserine decarboxylase